MKLIDIFKKFSWKEKSITFYILSLFTPMFIGAWSLVGLFGIFLGWIGVLSFEPSIGLPWIANIIYFVVLIFKKIKVKMKLSLTIIMIVFGLFAIGITTVPRDEGGENYEVTVGIGFGFWILSFVFMLMEQLKQLKNNNVG